MLILHRAVEKIAKNWANRDTSERPAICVEECNPFYAVIKVDGKEVFLTSDKDTFTMEDEPGRWTWVMTEAIYKRLCLAVLLAGYIPDRNHMLSLYIHNAKHEIGAFLHSSHAKKDGKDVIVSAAFSNDGAFKNITFHFGYGLSLTQLRINRDEFFAMGEPSSPDEYAMLAYWFSPVNQYGIEYILAKLKNAGVRFRFDDRKKKSAEVLHA